MANKYLKIKQYRNIVKLLADKEKISLDEALAIFYASPQYHLLEKEIGNYHCQGDLYIVEEISDYYHEKGYQNTKELKEIIIRDGECLPGDILKVDSFLNHQVDVEVMDLIGKEFARLFSDLKPDKILTIETSGVAIAQATSLNMQKQKVVYAKKDSHLNMSDNVYTAKEKSYTKDKYYTVNVSKEYLKEGDNILIIDDFLANGEALNSLLEICKQAKANVLAIGIVICKMYQPGYQRIKKEIDRLEVLAKIKSLNDNGQIEFE